MRFLCSFLLLAAGASASKKAPAGGPLAIETETGTYVGIINGTAPNVRQFLGIPYALPPVSDLRWLPPSPVTTNSSTVIDVTRIPLSCPQNISVIPTVYNQDITEFVIPQLANGSSAVLSSEDCLTLAVWTPTGNPQKLPVAVFMTGGFFNGGGIDIQYQLPHSWVQRTQKVVVVTINYRLNILGFPNAAGLSEQNLGILDQRMAIEWVRDHIEAFGGDPNKITLVGQSAGAASVDIHNFAYHEDPIAKGYYMMSGTSSILSGGDPSYANFTFVASQLGCGDLEPPAELDCMRKVPVQSIINFWGEYSDAGTSPPLAFGPVPDDKVIFSNYTERYAIGAVSKVPAILSTTANEGASLAAPYNQVTGPPPELALAATLLAFVCPARVASYLRAQSELTTYRYQYAGNFTNISPLPWLGAFHGSDIPMVFGSYDDFNGPATKFEEDVSVKMQELVMAFMEDPLNGPKKLGWGDFSGGQTLRFGAGDKVFQNISNTFDDACIGVGTYNPYP